MRPPTGPVDFTAIIVMGSHDIGLQPVGGDLIADPQGEGASTMFTWLRDVTIVLAALLPFIGQAFPYGVPLFFPCVLIAVGASLLCSAWRWGGYGLRVDVSPFPIIVALALLCFLQGLLLTTIWDASLRTEVASAVAALMLWVAVTNRSWSTEQVRLCLTWFSHVLMLVAVLLAALGLVKFMLLLGGERISFVEDAASGEYPWGTSLTVDYNMYALTMLAGALAAMAWLLSERSFFLKIIAAVLLLVLCTAGFLSGSRRFWVVAPLCLGLLFLGSVRQQGLKRPMKGMAILLGFLGAALLGLSRMDSVDWQEMASTGWDLQYRIATMLDGGGGLDSRFVRWDFAVSLLTDSRVWFGGGFDYMTLFGCRFDDCSDGGYPHNPFLSALLYAGIPGMFSILGMTVYFVYCGLHLLFGRSSMPFLGALLVAHIPYTLISSNGPFAVKSLLLSALLASLYIHVCKPSGESLGRVNRKKINDEPSSRLSEA